MKLTLRSLFCGFWLCALLLILSSPAMAELRIKDWRLAHHSDKTRFVLELSEKIDFRSFALNAPNRLVIDMPLGLVTAKFPTQKLDASGKIKSIRHGLLGSGTTRFVLDLGQPMRIKSAFTLPAQDGRPHRFVLDVVPVGQAEFNQALSNVMGKYNPHDIQLNAKPAVTQPVTAKPVIQAVTRPNTYGAWPKPVKRPGFTLTPQAQVDLGKKVIVLDPGHGGNDPGGITKDKTYEKHLTLAIARELRRQLLLTGRYTVYMTRDSDKYVKLHERKNIARKKGADLFISIHADKIGKSQVRGASVYTLSERSSDKISARLAEQANQSDMIAGVDLQGEDEEVADILIDLAMRETMNESKFFANTMVTVMKGRGVRLLNNTHRYAGFAVLKAPDVPSVLIEAGFLSNYNDVKLLKSKSYQRKLSESVTRAIDLYFQKMRQLRSQ